MTDGTTFLMGGMGLFWLLGAIFSAPSVPTRSAAKGGSCSHAGQGSRHPGRPYR